MGWKPQKWGTMAPGGGSARKEGWLLWPVTEKTSMPSSVGAAEHPFMSGSKCIKERWMLVWFLSAHKARVKMKPWRTPHVIDRWFQTTPLPSSFLPYCIPLATENFTSDLSLISRHTFCLPWDTLVPVKHMEPTFQGWPLPRSPPHPWM